MSDYTKRLKALSAEQRALLELQLQHKGLSQSKHLDVSAPVPPEAERVPEHPPASASGTAALDFSIMFFSAEVTGQQTCYQMLQDIAKFADEHNFTAIWTPERHFHRFGGLYPSPTVLNAALATITRRIQLRAGSIVMPLHNPIRLAEEWAAIDNLSNGRTGIAFASGWVPDDFILSQVPFERRKQAMYDGIKLFKDLWTGQPVEIPRAGGSTTIEIFPKPLQRELPIWIASSGNPESWVQAGAIGANVLTALLQMSVAEVADNIALYRESLARHGYDPQQGKVTLMLHTFIWDDMVAVRDKVRAPLLNYLRTHLSMYENQNMANLQAVDVGQITEADKEALAQFAFERYFRDHGLFGTPETCLPRLRHLRAIGVNELACLLDYGLERSLVLESLVYLNDLQEKHRSDA